MGKQGEIHGSVYGGSVRDGQLMGRSTRKGGIESA